MGLGACLQQSDLPQHKEAIVHAYELMNEPIPANKLPVFAIMNFVSIEPRKLADFIRKLSFYTTKSCTSDQKLPRKTIKSDFRKANATRRCCLWFCAAYGSNMHL